REITAFTPGGFAAQCGLPAYLLLAKKDSPAALRLWDDESSDPAINRMRLVARTVIHVLARDVTNAKADAEKARPVVDAKLKAQPEDVDAMLQLSWIRLALQEKAEALKNARQAGKLVPLEDDA